MKKLDEIKVPGDFKGTSVEVRSPNEYWMVLAIYLALGATMWPWHNGYKGFGVDDIEYAKVDGRRPHHLYGWEHCGFLKHAGIGESTTGTFANVDEFVNKAREVLGTNIIKPDEG